MKKLGIILLIVVAFFGYCIKLAMDNREAKRLPDILPGTTWRYTQEHFDRGLARYTIRVETQISINDREAKELAEYTQRTHTESENLIIFFDDPTRVGAFLKVVYPEGTFEKMETFAR